MAEEIKVAGVYKKLFEIQKKNLKFAKNAKGGFGKYVTYDALMEKLSPILEEQNLLIVHKTVETTHGHFAVETMVADMDEAGTVTSSFPLKEDLEPQKAGGAITYGKRYNVGEIFNMVIDVDDDGTDSSPKNVESGKASGSFKL